MRTYKKLKGKTVNETGQIDLKKTNKTKQKKVNLVSASVFFPANQLE